MRSLCLYLLLEIIIYLFLPIFFKGREIWGDRSRDLPCVDSLSKCLEKKWSEPGQSQEPDILFRSPLSPGLKLKPNLAAARLYVGRYLESEAEIESKHGGHSDHGIWVAQVAT